MKYLDYASVEALNSLLANGLGTRENGRFICRLEAFSLKSVSSDRKLYRKLESKYQDEIASAAQFGLNAAGASSAYLNTSGSGEDYYSSTDDEQMMRMDRYWTMYNPGFVSSPFGPLTLFASRKTFYYLISVLNAMFPDYDFSDVKPEQFSRISGPQSDLINGINSLLFNMSSAIGNGNSNSVAESCQILWKTIDDSIKLSECEIYSYLPDLESDPFTEDGVSWSFNYFFLNKKLKRVLFLVGGPNRYPLNPNPSANASLADPESAWSPDEAEDFGEDDDDDEADHRREHGHDENDDKMEEFESNRHFYYSDANAIDGDEEDASIGDGKEDEDDNFSEKEDAKQRSTRRTTKKSNPTSIHA